MALLLGAIPSSFGQQLTKAIVIDPIISGQGHGNKLALVIGNARYQYASMLDNPVNDATSIADQLRKSGFEIYGGAPQLNLTRTTFFNLVQDFGKAARDVDVALVYYSGHGMQISSVNYLIPVDATFEHLAEVPFQNVSVQNLLQLLEGAKLKIVMLDACRNNPFVGSGKGLTKLGLAPIDLAKTSGTIVSFATAPDELAIDGLRGQKNSPYAAALLTEMKKPGQGIWEFFNQVGLDVRQATQKEDPPQESWFLASSSPIAGTFYFTESNIPVQLVANATQVFKPDNLLTQQGQFTQVAFRPNETSIRLPPTVSNGSAIPYTGRAWQLMADNRYDEAIQQLTLAANADPASTTPYTFRGFANYWKGVRAIRAAYTNPSTLRTKWTSEIQPLFQSAEKDLDLAVRLNPVNQYGRRHLGEEVLAVFWARNVQGLPLYTLAKDAAKQFSDALKIDSTDRRTMYDLGVAYTLDGNYNAAVDQFSKIITMSPTYVLAYSGRCAALAKKGQTNLAQSDAIEAARRASQFRDQACLSYANTGDLEFFFRYD